MIVVKNIDQALELGISGVGLTIGNFDGLHQGHRQLIATLTETGARSLVMTFDPLPEQILSANPAPRLFPIEDQLNEFRSLGISYLYTVNFTKTLANLGADEFAKKYIFETFHPKFIILGYDFVFGRGRLGNIDLLTRMAIDYNCKVIQLEAFSVDGDIVSSSSIRKSIIKGEMEVAQRRLGRPFYLEGLVVEGKKIGRQLGVPTANLYCESEIFPGNGVYICYLPEFERYGVTNVGFNPTVTSGGLLKIECHILDFNLAIYGRRIRVQFLKKIRGEKKFSDLEQLKDQIDVDIEMTRSYQNSKPGPKPS